MDHEWLEEKIQSVHDHLSYVYRHIEGLIMATTQADIDAITQGFATLDETINSDAVGLASEIEGLKAANPNLDLTRLEAIKDKMTTDLSNVTSLATDLTPTDPTAPTGTVGGDVNGTVGTSASGDAPGSVAQPDPSTGDNSGTGTGNSGDTSSSTNS